MMKRYDMIVVGAGPAGLSAAIEAAKKGMHVVVYDENAKPGGQLFKQIHKFFGSKEHKAKIRGFHIGEELLAEAAELGVEVLPLSLQMGDRTYRNYLDGREIGFHEFYERVRSGELATTSAVNVGEFEEKMREILKTGKDILSISFSSALSTTKTFVLGLNTRSTEDGFAIIRIEIQIKDGAQLSTLMNKLHQISGVLQVNRPVG